MPMMWACHWYLRRTVGVGCSSTLFLLYVLDDDSFAWIDIFAVLQHGDTPELQAEQRKDLNFVGVVQSCGTLVLIAAHLDSVANLDQNLTAIRQVSVPQEDRKRCAFYRVWCLVELAAAEAKKIPAVMLVGSSDEWGAFVPNPSMLGTMLQVVDVADADATVASDRVMILDEMLPDILQQPRDEAIKSVNRIAKSACSGALASMASGMPREALQAAVGNTAPLLSSDEMTTTIKGNSLVVASAAGFTHTLDALLEVYKPTQEALDSALYQASQGDQKEVVPRLLAAGANVNGRVDIGGQSGSKGITPLIGAATAQSADMMRLILAARANINDVTADANQTALHRAAGYNATPAALVLIEANADPNIADNNGVTPLIYAAADADVALTRALLSCGADPTHVSSCTSQNAFETATDETVKAILKEAIDAWKPTAKPPAAPAQATAAVAPPVQSASGEGSSRPAVSEENTEGEDGCRCFVIS